MTFGDNRDVPMDQDDSTTNDRLAVPRVASARSQARELARRAIWRFAPAYAKRRVRNASESDRLRRLEQELERVGERHSEQIDRLEDLTRELVLSVASLRREIGRDDRQADG
jgi:hypothetical protein